MSIFKNNILVCEIVLVHSMVNAKEIKMAKQDSKYEQSLHAKLCNNKAHCANSYSN